MSEKVDSVEDENRRTLVGLHAVAPHELGKQAGLTPQDLKELPSTGAGVEVTCIDYSPQQVHVEKVTDLEDFIIRNRPGWSAVRWINVEGLGNMDVIRAFAEKYDLHPLAIEDTIHVPQRPKVETYGSHGEAHGRIFIIARMLTMQDEHVRGEQISLFLGRKTLITFQEGISGDVFDTIRTRIQAAGSRVRENDASFLMYSLIDAIVDHCFPILEHYSDVLETLEEEVLTKPDRSVIHSVHMLKRQLLLLRRAAWPMREVISNLSREQHECLSENTRTYLRDVYDHSVQIIDMIETYREFATGLTETYMSAMSTRMNEIMKVLTIITTIFVPLTFLAGVYGMNFTWLPEKDIWWAYPAFWVVCLVVAGGMVVWFRRRHWL